MSTMKPKRFSCSALAIGLALLTLPWNACLAAPELSAYQQVGTNLISSENWTLLQPMVGNAQLSTIRMTGPSGRDERVIQVAVNMPAQTIYNIQITQAIATAIPADHLLKYHFWARSTAPHLVRAVVEKDAPPYPGILGTDSIALTPAWKEYTFTADTAGILANAYAARLQLGLQSGAVQFADVEVQDLGIDPALASDAAALQPAAVQARIRKYRMADLTVRVVNRNGYPLSNVKIAVQQQRHAFLFGCNIFGLRDISAASSAPADLQAQKAYRAQFAGLFNYATLPFYWGAFEPQPAQPDFPRLTWMAQWCRQHGITTKAHPLVWQQVYPTWAPSKPDEAIPLLHKRVDSIVDNMSGLSNYYDAINETLAASSYTPSNGESLWIARDGAAAVTATVLGWARSAAKSEGAAHDRFIVNDYIADDNYANLFRRLQSRGSLPDAIGIQSHMHSGTWPMRQVWDTCQRFVPFGIPIHFTETTVLSTLTPHAVDMNGPIATDWPTTPEGESAQADYAAHFYTVLFSHPSVRAITWWDLSDRDAWLGAPAGLLRKDMSPKPAYTKLIALIKHAWWTDASGTSNHLGKFTTRAFYGDYLIHATDSRGRVVATHISMPEGDGAKTITLKLP